ncbi:catechol 2,3-dioxygenase-like lactoylglutathione lyase family enzyme [Streptococcus rupicaprae]|uniref:Catechol 2,3-dioxygenase-like lactoylglutathione lyase family enzyme n=1 Tax=Streptococcus rupicaprae TaxID=759619 RepID=A0ABV2FEN0_9STRE
MKKVDTIQTVVPVLKVNNRAQNLAFYEDVLGLKILQEENAFIDLGGHGERTVLLTLEESPSMRTRQVRGDSKLVRLVFKVANSQEIEALLAKGVSYQTLFRGQNGWAFSAISPEGHEVLLHSETSLEDLEPVEAVPSFDNPLTVFLGVTVLKLDQVIIRTPEPDSSQAFYQSLFGDQLPVSFLWGQGEDLQADNSLTWDLVGFDIQASPDLALAELKTGLTNQGLDVFLDKKERLLALEDPNRLSLSLRR